MDCQTVHDHLSAYLDQDLPLPTHELLDIHLRRCARCRREFFQLRTVVAWVRDLPPIEPPSTFLTNVLQRVEHLPRRSTSGLFRRLAGALPLQVAAAVALAVSAALVWYIVPGLGQRQGRFSESPVQLIPWVSHERTVLPAKDAPPIEQIFEEPFSTSAPLVQAPAGRPVFVAQGRPWQGAYGVAMLPTSTGSAAEVRTGEIMPVPNVIVRTADPEQTAQQVWEIVPRSGGALLRFQGMVTSAGHTARGPVQVTLSLASDHYQTLLDAIRRLPDITVREERMAIADRDPRQETAPFAWGLEAHSSPMSANMMLVITILPR